MITTKINLRVDIVSKQKYNKKDLIKIVKNKKNEITIDREYNQEGRSVYFIPSLENLNIIKKKNLLSRGLKISIPDSIYEVIQKEIEENWNGK